MTKIACVFPGQGSQKIGMGKELYDNFSCAKEVFDEVDDALSQKLSSIIFDGVEADLTLTENAQPAIMATSIAAFRVLEQETGFKLSTASYVAGHSLGEYSALAAAGSISLADTAWLLKTRGQAMQAAVPTGKGGMAAIIGLEMDAVEQLVKNASVNGEICEVANDNSNGQVVISGSIIGVEKACVLAKEAGAKRALPLSVSAPFHSSLMSPAAEVMFEALEKTKVKEPIVSIITNVTAKAENDPNIIRDLLVKQVTGRVRWRESVEYMNKNEVSSAIEIGEGKVLSGLIRRIAPNIECKQIGKVNDIEKLALAA